MSSYILYQKNGNACLGILDGTAAKLSFNVIGGTRSSHTSSLNVNNLNTFVLQYWSEFVSGGIFHLTTFKYWCPFLAVIAVDASKDGTSPWWGSRTIFLHGRISSPSFDWRLQQLFRLNCVQSICTKKNWWAWIVSCHLKWFRLNCTLSYENM